MEPVIDVLVIAGGNAALCAALLFIDGAKEKAPAAAMALLKEP